MRICDVPKCVDHQPPLVLPKERGMLTRHPRIGCDVAQHGQAERRCGPEVRDMAGMDRIEAAIHHRHPLLAASEVRRRHDHLWPSRFGATSEATRGASHAGTKAASRAPLIDVVNAASCPVARSMRYAP